jgi:hypothetical protein
MRSTRPRLRRDPTTNLPSIHTFGELSSYLRGSVADEESRQFSESMRALSEHIEGIVRNLRVHRVRAEVAPLLVDLLTVVRAHRQLVVSLGLPWRALYEYAAYLQALNNFRLLIGQWLLEGGTGSDELNLTAEDFELVAWRTLGEGTLLIDMYEEGLHGDFDAGDTLLSTVPDRQVDRAVQWWKKLGR